MTHIHYVIEFEGDIEEILHTVEEVETQYVEVNEDNKEDWEAFKSGNSDYFCEDDYEAPRISRVYPKSSE